MTPETPRQAYCRLAGYVLVAWYFGARAAVAIPYYAAKRMGWVR